MPHSASTPRFSWLMVLIPALIALFHLVGPATPTASAASPCQLYGGTAATSLQHGEARAAIRCLVNRERGQRGLKGLDRDRRLQRAAQNHTEVMRKTQCLAHQCPGEATLAARLWSVNYLLSGLSRWLFSENVAWGPGAISTPKSIVRAWMNSSGHRAQILNPLFRDLGVGFLRGRLDGSGTNGGIYTTDFGLRIL